MKHIKSITKEQRALQLFCFPYAGGSASIYFSWRDKISSDIEILTIQLPARGELFLEDAIVDMDILVERLYREILPYLNRPFAFFGHSMGGVIAYALLKKIEQYSHYRAKFIIISATKSPSNYYGRREHLLTNKALKEKLIEHNATPKEILENSELMELILPIYRADLELIHTYNPLLLPKIKSKLYLFNSLEDMSKERIMKWSDYFEQEVGYYEFLGGHFFINSNRDWVISKISILSTPLKKVN
jgi:medium-chain acyl-[acyl-carrier-protein] hydrolase